MTLNKLNWWVFAIGTILFVSTIINLGIDYWLLHVPLWDGLPSSMKVLLATYTAGLFALAFWRETWEIINIRVDTGAWSFTRRTVTHYIGYILGFVFFAAVHVVEVFDNHHELSMFVAFLMVDVAIEQGFAPFRDYWSH